MRSEEEMSGFENSGNLDAIVISMELLGFLSADLNYKKKT